MKKNIVFYVALYIRLSREDGDKEESDSVSNQKKLLVEYIEDKEDFVLKDIYVDDGYTGTNFRRPDFNRMITDIEERKVNCVIVKDLSRFGRDYIDTGRYLERFFPEKGVRFISISDGIDSMKQAYDMLLPIKNIFNEQYARDISKKVQATVRMKQQSGEFIGAFTSYGYKKSPADKNKLIIDEYAAGVVRRIFDMYISGIGKQKIARILTDEGVLCPSVYKRTNGELYKNSNFRDACYWTYSTVNSILHREIYIGNMVQGTKHQIMRGRQNRVPKEDWIIVENTHEPIIDQDTWDKAQKLLQRRTRDLDLTTNQNIFAGFIRCGDCDAAMTKISWIRADGSKTNSFYCGTYKRHGNRYCSPHTLPFRVLEQIILEDLNKIIGSIQNLEQMAKEQPVRKKWDAENQIKEQISRLETELTKTKRLKQSLYEDYKDELLSKEEYLDYYREYADKEKLLQKKIKDLQEKQKLDIHRGLESSWVTRLLQLRKIETLDRSIIVEMIDRILVYDNQRIRIIYNFSNELQSLFEQTLEIRN